MCKTIPDRCPLLIPLKHWKKRDNFVGIEKGYEFGWVVCSYKKNSIQAHRGCPSDEIYGRPYLCTGGNYVDCPAFSEWFWNRVIKNSKVKMVKK